MQKICLLKGPSEEILQQEDFQSSIPEVKENNMSRANSELSDAKKIAEGLASQVAQFRVRARTWRMEVDRLKKRAGGEKQWTLTNDEAGSTDRYLEVVRELEAAKFELSNLKLGMASALQEKKKAEKEVQVVQSRMESDVKVMEELEKKIEAANEEHVLVELARVEASRECRELGAHRKADKENFARKLEEAKARRMDLMKEIKHAEGLEMKLEITTSDLEVLQNEMVFVRAMSKNLLSDNSLARSSKKKDVETKSSRLLQNSIAELDVAKKELASIKEEGFRFMSSLDVAREEMNQVSSEVSRLKALEEEADTIVQNLHSELLKANSKLEAVSAADRKSKAILSSFSTIECSWNDAERSKEQRKITEEIEILKSETEKNDAFIDATKKKLLEAVHELEAAKASEALALERLRALSGKEMYRRDSLGVQISKITISHGEHEYLRKGARGAKELAAKKVEAAQAWVEALRTSQKQALFQTEIVCKDIEEIKELEEKEVYKVKESLTAKGEQGKHRQLEKDSHHSHMATSQFKLTAPRKSLKANDLTHSSRRSATHRRRSISPGEALMEEIGGLFDVTVLDGESQLVELQQLKSLKANAIITHSSRRSVTCRRRSISHGQALIAKTKGLSDVIVLDKESQLVELQQLKSVKTNAITRSSRRSTTHRMRAISPQQALIVETGRLSDVIVLDEESQAVEQQQHRTAPTRKSVGSSRRSVTRRRSSISGNQILPRSPTMVVRKRRKVMPNLFKFLRERRAGNHKLAS